MRVFLCGKFGRGNVIVGVDDALGVAYPSPVLPVNRVPFLRCSLDARPSRHESAIYKRVDLAGKVCDCFDSPRVTIFIHSKQM